MGKPFRIVMQMIDFGMFVYERSKRESATDRVNRLLAGRYTATWPEGKTALKIVAEAKKRLDAKQ